MKYLFIQLFLLAISFHSHAQDTTEIKRTPYKLTVAVDDSSVYEQDIKAGPYIFPDKTIQLYPGENIYVEVEQDNGIIKSMKTVKENKNPSKTLSISFTQSTKNKVHEEMILKILNPFSQNLVYKANIFLLKQNKWVNTDVLPIQSGLSGYETWPDIIISIALGKWTFQNK